MYGDRGGLGGAVAVEPYLVLAGTGVRPVGDGSVVILPVSLVNVVPAVDVVQLNRDAHLRLVVDDRGGAAQLGALAAQLKDAGAFAGEVVSVVSLQIDLYLRGVAGGGDIVVINVEVSLAIDRDFPVVGVK